MGCVCGGGGGGAWGDRDGEGGVENLLAAIDFKQLEVTSELF